VFRARRGRRRGGRRRGGGSGGVYAALDLGTNNCRLLVARPGADGFRVIDAFSRIVRLGEGLSATGRLSEAAMGRTIDALRVCAAKIQHRRVTLSRAVATEACRRAENCSEFLERVNEQTGIELEIISSDEEATLALYGCAPLLDPGIEQALVFDIGGGSTELAWLAVEPVERAGSLAALPRLIAWHSLPFGVVSLAERYGGHELDSGDYEIMVREIEAALDPFEAEHGLNKVAESGCVQMLGTSGTVTTLAGVYKELPRYDRSRVDGTYLDFETVRDVSGRIVAMSYRERVAQPCIGAQRADLVIAGCAILEAICRTWPIGMLRVADRGLREGILFTMMSRAPSGAGARIPSPDERAFSGSIGND
jgi:exopolyphosphatase/guanosine-5'-triphosphate,3'-diphosphate pyrophosphatase